MTPQDLAVQFEHAENCHPAEDVLVVEAAEGPIGFVAAEWREEPLNALRIYIHTAFLVPEWRRRGIGTAMLAWAEERLERIASEHPQDLQKLFHAAVADVQAGALCLLEKHGYQAVRYEYLMVRPTLADIPDLPLPGGLEIRPALPDHYRRIWAANNEAFRDHWGYYPLGEEDYQRWINEANFDPSLWRVAWAGDEVAGMVLSFIRSAENEAYHRLRGYTEEICVRGPWRRLGLARALIASSLRGLRARGMSEAALGVDTENVTGALRLYEGLGYRPVERWTLLRRQLGPARTASPTSPAGWDGTTG